MSAMRKASPALIVLGALAALPILFPPVPRAAQASFVSPEVPRGRTSADRLAPDGLVHHEVLRIDPDVFGPKRTYDIVLDGWTRDGEKAQIAEVRLWWLDRAKADERSPFGKGVRRNLDIRYQPAARDQWEVDIIQGGRTFRFDIELDKRGRLSAFGTVETEDGQRVHHCRAVKSKIKPRMALGIPTGMKSLDVTCVDDKGKRHRGALVPS